MAARLVRMPSLTNHGDRGLICLLTSHLTECLPFAITCPHIKTRCRHSPWPYSPTVALLTTYIYLPQAFDGDMEKKCAAADKNGNVLRFVGVVDVEKGSVTRLYVLWPY